MTPTRSRFPKRTMVCYQCDIITPGLHPLLAVSFMGEHWEHPDKVADFNETHLAVTLDWASLVVVRAERHLIRYEAAA